MTGSTPSRAGEPAKPRVVHCKREPYDVYIGRPGKWGNPFRVSGDSEAQRENAIRQYERWLLARPLLMAALPELRGKTLGCWCAPKACHGDVLLRLANAVECCVGGSEGCIHA